MKLILTLLTTVFSVFGVISAQTDTTELNVGKKKLIIIDKKTQKENAIYNLEKGKEYFEKQIAETDKKIEQYKKQIKELQLKADSVKKTKISEIEINYDLSENLKKNILDSIQTEIEKELKNEKLAEDIKIVIVGKDNDDLNKIIENKIDKLVKEQEIQQIKTEIENIKLLIETEKKKREAFKQGIEDIENGIAEIQNGINNLNKELEKNEKYIKKEIKTGNINRSRFNAHLAGFEFGLLNFLTAKRTFATPEELDFMVFIPEKTMSYGLNIFEYDLSFEKSGKFGAATGAGLEWNSIALSRNVDLYEDEDGIIRAEYINPTEIKYDKNKFNAVYVTVPLIIEVQIPTKKRKFYFGAGITGSVRAWSKQKQKYTLNGQKYKNKKVDDFRLSSFRYGAKAEIGYGDIGFYLNYHLTPFFDEGAGPEMFPVSLGIKIVDF